MSRHNWVQLPNFYRLKDINLVLFWTYDLSHNTYVLRTAIFEFSRKPYMNDFSRRHLTAKSFSALFKDSKHQIWTQNLYYYSIYYILLRSFWTIIILSAWLCICLLQEKQNNMKHNAFVLYLSCISVSVIRWPCGFYSKPENISPDFRFEVTPVRYSIGLTIISQVEHRKLSHLNPVFTCMRNLFHSRKKRVTRDTH